MSLHDRFIRSGFAQFVNSTAGRVVRILAGLAFLAVGYVYRGHTLGVVSMVWGLVPLAAGSFDWCLVSALLGGPMAGAKVRAAAATSPRP